MIRTSALYIALLMLSACADYQFTINDRVVYSPEPVFKDYVIGDSALRDCISQHLGEAGHTGAGQLLELNCSHAGITDLQGIEVFSGLQRLQLANNALTSVAPLATLAGLEILHLEGNQLKSLLPLRGLELLSSLNVGDNPTLVCGELGYFAALPGLSLEIPKHCTKKQG